MECGLLVLWRFAHFAKHLGRAGEIKAALWLQFAQGRKHVVGAVDVCIHRREAVGKRFGDETLRSQVVTLVKLMFGQDVKDRGVALKACRVKRDPIEQVLEPGKAPGRILKSDTSNETMHFVV